MKHYELNWHQSDIESKCGFASKKLTDANLLFTFLLGTLFFIIFYGILTLSIMVIEPKAYEALPFVDAKPILQTDSVNQLAQAESKVNFLLMFFNGEPSREIPGGYMIPAKNKNRSSIPYFTLFLGCWAFAILLVKWAKLHTQSQALKLRILPTDTGFILNERTSAEIIHTINQKVDDPYKFLLFDRVLRCLANLKNLGNVQDVAEGLNTQSDNDDKYLASTYTILKALIWAIPVLGFIGTVLGLSSAIGGFGDTVSNLGSVSGDAKIDLLTNSLSGVTSGLGTAFETTLIALVIALLIQMFTSLVQKKEELFLDDCADYCHKNLIARLRISALDHEG